MITKTQAEIMEELAEHPGGITFNKLVEKMKRKASRMTIFKEVKNLLSKGYIKIERDPNHKQRRSIHLREDFHKFLLDFKELERKILQDPFHNLTGFLTSYIERIQGLREGWMKELARHRLRRHMDEVLTKLEEAVCRQRSY